MAVDESGCDYKREPTILAFIINVLLPPDLAKLALGLLYDPVLLFTALSFADPTIINKTIVVLVFKKYIKNIGALVLDRPFLQKTWGVTTEGN